MLNKTATRKNCWKANKYDPGAASAKVGVRVTVWRESFFFFFFFLLAVTAFTLIIMATPRSARSAAQT